MAAKSAGGILFCLIANGKSVLVGKKLRDGNFVQYAKLIVASNLEQEGDHVRSYYDKSHRFAFHAVVFQGLTYLCFARVEMEKNVCVDFLYDVAAAFRESYAASLDDTNPEVFEDFEVQIAELMEEFGRAVLEPGKAGRMDRMRNKQFCGMRDADGCFLPVRQHVVECTIHGVCAKVVITKKYRNSGTEPVECFFTFKEDGVTVVGLEVSRGKQQISNLVCSELKSDLGFIVREITKGGRGAFLLEEADETETLNVALGAVAPGGKIKVTLTYVMQVEMAGSLFEVLVPATRVWGDMVGAVFALTINLDMVSPIERVECSSGHSIECETSGNTGIVTVDSENLLQVNSELLLFITVASPHAPMLSIEHAPTGGMATLCLGWNPLFKANLAEDMPSEFVFLVDRGKALQGRKMGRVKSALHLWLHSLPSGCSFNIVGFGDAVVKLFAKAQTYQDSSLRQASVFISSLEADSSSTSALATALADVFAEAPIAGHTKQLFVMLADEGGTERAEDVLPAVAAGAKTARVYTFALGPRSNQPLARRIAKVASGFYEYLPSDQFLEAAVVDRVVRSSGPSLTRVTIDWGVSGVTEQVPSTLPCIYSDNRNLFVAFAAVPSGALAAEKEIKAIVHGRVTAIVDGSDTTRDVEVSSQLVSIRSSSTTDNVLFLNRCVHAVHELAADVSSGRSGSGARSRLLQEACDAVVHVAGVTELSLVNSQTQRPDAQGRVVPHVDLHHVARPRDIPIRHVSEPPPPPPPTPGSRRERRRTANVTDETAEKKAGGGLWSWFSGGDDGKGAVGSSSSSSSSSGKKTSEKERALRGNAGEDEADRESFRKSADDLEQFLQLQRSNGRWLCDTVLAAFFQNLLQISRSDITSPPRKLKETLPSLSVQQQNDVWTTALAVQMLQLFFADAEPHWAGMCAKSKGFLFRAIKRQNSTASPATIAAEARSFLDLAAALLEEKRQ